MLTSRSNIETINRVRDDKGFPKRILFLAMSGVRVQNPRLLALGLTLPGFVDRGKVIASLPSLGLLTLAAHTPDDC